MDLSKFLADANKTWGETVEKAGSGSFENLDDGNYVVQLASADLGESKAGNPQIKFGHTVLEGENAGRIIYDFLQLAGKLGLEPLAWRLNALGVKIEDIDLTELQSVLDGLVEDGLVMKVGLKTKDEYQNMRILKMLPDYESEEYSSTPAPAAKPSKAEAAKSAPPAKGKKKPEQVELPDDAPEAGTLPEGGDEDDDDGEGVDLAIGMKVSFEKGGKTLSGVVKKIDEDAETADVKVGVKTHTVSFDDMEVEEEGTDS